jgi:hypothetical protein
MKRPIPTVLLMLGLAILLVCRVGVLALALFLGFQRFQASREGRHVFAPPFPGRQRP